MFSVPVFGTSVVLKDQPDGVLTLWLIQSFGKSSKTSTHIVPIAVDPEGRRLPAIEKLYRSCINATPADAQSNLKDRQSILINHIVPTLQREISPRGIIEKDGGLSSRLLVWLVIQ